MTIRNVACGVTLLIAAMMTTGCIHPRTAPDAAALPPTELRAMQTRTYDAPGGETMLKTVLDVLQDDGFIVDYGHTELGILHAVKTITSSGDQLFNRTDDFFAGAAGQRQYTGSTAKVEATVNVSPSGQRTKVRIGLQRTTSFIAGSSYYGTVIDSQAGTIVDAKIYQEFFAKLDRGVFLHKQGL
jgi:hypothetical protein